jgi:hypothetical protein
MPIWLDTRGKTTLGIGQCDRCWKKRSLEDLVPDNNAPGMRVCKNRCCDVFDPYRLPPRQPDDLTLPFYRPVQPDLTYDIPPVFYDGLSTDTLLWIEPTSPYGPPDGGMYAIEVT